MNYEGLKMLPYEGLTKKYAFLEKLYQVYYIIGIRKVKNFQKFIYGISMKKILLLILFLFNEFSLFSLESFDISQLRFLKDVQIVNETVTASETLIRAKTEFKTVEENIECSIECRPNGNGRSYTLAAIPMDLKVKCNNIPIDYEVLYDGKKINAETAGNIQADKKSIITFTLKVKKDQLNSLEISYQNYSFREEPYIEKLNNQCMVFYVFASKTSNKKFEYIEASGSDSFLCKCFVSKNDVKKIVDLSRAYKNDAINWSCELESGIDKILYLIQTFTVNTYYLDIENKYVSKPVSKYELFFLAKEQLATLRNSIYAVHGYGFKTVKWIKYFTENFLGYEINPNFSESDFNEVEKKNIELIRYMENTTEPLLLSDYVDSDYFELEE